MNDKTLSQEPCEMTAEEYRQRMIQAFHNADCDELIAICVLPTEKEFEHLEWLLKNHYKQEPCEDAISRDAVLNAIEHEDKWLLAAKGHNGLTEIAFSGLKARVDALPSVTPSRHVNCEIAEHDGNGCLGYSHYGDDFPIEECLHCPKYTSYEKE